MANQNNRIAFYPQPNIKNSFNSNSNPKSESKIIDGWHHLKAIPL